MATLGWTNERVESLTKLWRDGLSASQIARQLGGVTRNAVIGKVHRLGLSGRAAPSRPCRAASTTPRAARADRPMRPRVRPVAPPRAPRTAQTPQAPVEAEPEGPGLVASMTGLAAHLCKWPIGDPKAAEFSFCGRLAAGDGPYCLGHRAAAYRPGKAAPLSRDPLVRRVLAGLAA